MICVVVGSGSAILVGQPVSGHRISVVLSTTFRENRATDIGTRHKTGFQLEIPSFCKIAIIMLSSLSVSDALTVTVISREAHHVSPPGCGAYRRFFGRTHTHTLRLFPKSSIHVPMYHNFVRSMLQMKCILFSFSFFKPNSARYCFAATAAGHYQDERQRRSTAKHR